MQTVTTTACILSVCLTACATGSSPDDSLLEGDSGVSEGGEIIIVGDAGATSSSQPNSGVTGGGFQGGGGGGYDSGSGGFTDFDASASSFGGDDSGSFSFDSGLGGFDLDSGFAGLDSGGSTCDGFAPPSTSAGCYCSASDPWECQPNGCYGGYYCDTSSDTCTSEVPAGC